MFSEWKTNKKGVILCDKLTLYWKVVSVILRTSQRKWSLSVLNSAHLENLGFNLSTKLNMLDVSLDNKMYILTSSWAQCCQHSWQPTRKLQAGFLCCPKIQNINVEMMIPNNNCETIMNKFQPNAPVTDWTLQVCALDPLSACSRRCRTWHCQRSAERWSGRWSGWSRRGCRSALLRRGGIRQSPGSHLEQIMDRMECGRAWLEEEECWTYERKIEIGNPGSALRFTISWVDVVGC